MEQWAEVKEIYLLGLLSIWERRMDVNVLFGLGNSKGIRLDSSFHVVRSFSSVNKPNVLGKRFYVKISIISCLWKSSTVGPNVRLPGNIQMNLVNSISVFFWNLISPKHISL